ncbi:MAG: hypothetical protein GXP48_10240 [Acidobacteria bacterium]|nr:hypothetical protein [Acidobacteriota bacterium]
MSGLRGARVSLLLFIMLGIGGCTLYSVPEQPQYGGAAIWRNTTVPLDDLVTFSWKPGTRAGLEAGSMLMAPGVVDAFRKGIVANLASCWKLKSSGRVDFWLSFALEPNAAASPVPVPVPTNARPPFLEVFIGVPGYGRPAWASAIPVPDDFASSGAGMDAIVHDLLMEFPNGTPRRCR